MSYISVGLPLGATGAIRAAVREGKIHQIYGMMQAGTKYGMQTMNQSLLTAVRRRLLSREDALERSFDPKELEQMFGRAAAPVPAGRR